MKGRHNAAATLTALGLVTLFAAPTGHAMPIDFEPVVGTIQGTQTLGFEFEVVDAGTYTAILTDFGSPAPFDLLGLALANDFGFLIDEVIGTGTLELTFSVDPGRYVALVGGIADADVNIGTIGLEISDVPIPAAGYLLGTALVGPLLMKRRRGRAAAA